MPVIAGKIGSSNCTVFDLEPANLGYTIEAIKRPGVDYHAYKYMGAEYPEQDLTIQQEFSTHALAVAAATTYNALVGTNQALERGGVAYGTYKFLKPAGGHYPRVSPPKYSPIMIGSSASLASGWIVQSVHRVQRQS
jgi:hypothetical protein